MIEKIKKYVKTTIAGVLVLSLVLQAFHGMKYVLANEETTEPATYTVTLTDAAQVFISNKEATTGTVRLSYKVESCSYTCYQQGAMATTKPTEQYPYLNNAGNLKYNNGRSLTMKGASYVFTMSLDKSAGTLQYQIGRTKADGTTSTVTFGQDSGTSNTNAQYFGLFIDTGTDASGNPGTPETAVLTVTCVDAETGKDLGVQVNGGTGSRDVVKKEIEEPEEPTGAEKYSIVLNQASRVFICNKEVTTEYPITLTYTVHPSTTRSLYQNGIMATTTPDEPYPFSTSTGYLKHKGHSRLWTYQLGATYKVTLDLTTTGDITPTIERILADGSQSDPDQTFANTAGVPIPEATHLGIWIADSGQNTPENAVLTNVSCVDAAGKDLGVKVVTDATCEVVKNETVTLDAKYETYQALSYLLSGTGDLTVNGEAKENGYKLTQVGDYEIQWDYYGRITKQKIVIYQLGNAHLDENIDVCDLVAIKKEADEHYLDTEAAMLGADVNDSKTVDDADVAIMREVLVGTATLDEPAAVSYALNDTSVMPIAGYNGPCG